MLFIEKNQYLYYNLFVIKECNLLRVNLIAQKKIKLLEKMYKLADNY